jgi:ribosomal protein S18 acetylase RimI-like enzyme
MNITKATIVDIDKIMELIRQAVRIMRKNEIDQWDETYPSKKIIADDIVTGSLYKIIINGNMAGIITLNEQQSPEYLSLLWRDYDGRPLVVHRICVHPQFQGKNLARQLMQFAEEYAGTYNYSSIRLDTYSKNYIALKLYESLKYQRVGDVSLRDGKIFHCYEKVIKPKSQL